MKVLKNALSATALSTQRTIAFQARLAKSANINSTVNAFSSGSILHKSQIALYANLLSYEEIGNAIWIWHLFVGATMWIGDDGLPLCGAYPLDVLELGIHRMSKHRNSLFAA